MKEKHKKEVILQETWNMIEATVNNMNYARTDCRIKSKEIHEKITENYMIFVENLKRRGYYE